MLLFAVRFPVLIFFFFNDTATTEIYTLSLHDALPISHYLVYDSFPLKRGQTALIHAAAGDRKSTRLNSSHSQISYAVFCLKKKKEYNRLSRGWPTLLSSSARNAYCKSQRDTFPLP